MQETAALTGKPILQIVHVSDLHFQDASANSNHPLQENSRWFARALHKFIEPTRFWESGTRGHILTAPSRFQDFLRRWRQNDPKWYAGEGEEGAKTWLVDSGDLTTVGDQASVNLGRQYLSRWAGELGNCEIRSIYGNHDAWPGTFPIYRPGASGINQRQKVESARGWDSQGWLNNPLRIQIPGAGDTWIELFALNSVSWRVVPNTLAIGEIDPSDFASLRAAIDMRFTASGPNYRSYRILVCHHPIVFPYNREERFVGKVIPQMQLSASGYWARQLRNDANVPVDIGPLAHMILSGHAHGAYPAGALPAVVTDVLQRPLHRSQLQLVGSSLMLIDDDSLNQQMGKALARFDRSSASTGRNQVAKSEHLYATANDSRQTKRFHPAVVNGLGSQAEILQFFQRGDSSHLLDLIVTPVYSVRGRKYLPGKQRNLVVQF